MIVRMVHPEHGAMHVYDAGELERNRQYGWVPEDEAQVPAINGDTSREPEDVIAPGPSVLYERDALVKAEGLHEMRDEGVPARRKPGRPRKGE